MTEKKRVLIISDFNADFFRNLLAQDLSAPELVVTAAPFGQVMPLLLDQNAEIWQSTYDYCVVWTTPAHVISSFGDVINFQSVNRDQMLAEVDQFAALLEGLKDRVGTVFAPSWVHPANDRGYGVLDMKSGLGIAEALMAINLRLCESLQASNSVYILNSQPWFQNAGKTAFPSKLWYLGKIPFDQQIFRSAVSDVKSAVDALEGKARKLVVLDLDDTLWGGIVGDAGWENLKLGGHDPIGESFADFQKALKALQNRGIILAVVSKNEESVALEAIARHPEMILKMEDFAAWRINWNDKAQNIAELTAELNIGLQSVVFIDDNPVERARVREALPEVLVPEWPKDKTLYRQTLRELTCFDNPALSDEDRQRTEMYVTERDRKQSLATVGSIDDWLKTLNVTVDIAPLSTDNQARTVQLLNKTNQMNLSTRRMTESEFTDWAAQDEHHVWTFRVSDKFGDSGLTGIASVAVKGEVCQIVDFVLSCRVFGRKIEDAMLYHVRQFAQENGCKTVKAKFLPTPKNKPCIEFLNRTFTAGKDDASEFELDVKSKLARPEINMNQVQPEILESKA